MHVDSLIIKILHDFHGLLDTSYAVYDTTILSKYMAPTDVFSI